ncbi:Deoxyribose-phosphate aldolase type I DeoC [[Mycoplasma] cavipharyngis]|uniref:deoxyribose-phosphate aldolase n=1 Tax=[Mycoplasma] cavipharyngis TaxID=92757 RepID=UPI003703E0CE
MINKYIDHTNLKVSASEEDIKALCTEALEYKFRAVCVPGCYVKFAADLLAGSDVRVCSVVGFPLGYSDTKTKIFEASSLAINGAVEVDVVININKLKEGDKDYLIEELLKIKSAIKGRILKVIVETGLLTEEEKHLVCEVLNVVSPHYVKTSTGFAGENKGATVEDIILLKSLLDKNIRIKASGGIRNYHQAKALIKAGAQRIGTSNGVSIYEEYMISDVTDGEHNHSSKLDDTDLVHDQSIDQENNDQMTSEHTVDDINQNQITETTDQTELEFSSDAASDSYQFSQPDYIDESGEYYTNYDDNSMISHTEDHKIDHSEIEMIDHGDEIMNYSEDNIIDDAKNDMMSHAEDNIMNQTDQDISQDMSHDDNIINYSEDSVINQTENETMIDHQDSMINHNQDNMHQDQNDQDLGDTNQLNDNIFTHLDDMQTKSDDLSDDHDQSHQNDKENNH